MRQHRDCVTQGNTKNMDQFWEGEQNIGFLGSEMVFDRRELEIIIT